MALGDSGAGPPPMSVPRELSREQPVYLPRTGSAAVERGPEYQNPSGPRNCSGDKSSSPSVQVEEITFPTTQREEIDEPRPPIPEHDASRSMIEASPPASMDQVHSIVQPLPMSDNGQLVRPKRVTCAPDRLIMGDPSHPRFNRTQL